MQLTLISRNFGTQTIDTETFNPCRVSKSSTIYRIVEHIFEQWCETASAVCVDPYLNYYDEPAVFEKGGAITQGIEVLIEIAEERNLETLTVTTRELQNWDIESAFE